MTLIQGITKGAYTVEANQQRSSDARYILDCLSFGLSTGCVKKWIFRLLLARINKVFKPCPKCRLQKKRKQNENNVPDRNMTGLYSKMSD
jgi:hypothetical protein